MTNQTSDKIHGNLIVPTQEEVALHTCEWCGESFLKSEAVETELGRNILLHCSLECKADCVSDYYSPLENFDD